MTSIRRFGWTALALFAVGGCAPVAPPVTPPVAGGTAGNATGGTAGASAESNAPTEIKPMPVEEGKPKEGAAVDKPLSDEQVAEIKKLPADEQPIALAQKFCPVSGDPLGGEMGMPVKQKIGDTTFFICCESCEKKVKSKPDDVLAALAKLKK
jgi:hypothetical protein